MCFSKLLKDNARFARGPQILFAFIEIYWSLVEAILIYYWRVLSMIWKKSSTSFISPIYFWLNHRENGNEDSSSEAYLKSPKTRRGPYLDLELSIFVKILEFYLSPSPFLGGGGNSLSFKCMGHGFTCRLLCDSIYCTQYCHTVKRPYFDTLFS
jgi:hypothetical protein